jgi:hypothetical protein
VTDDSNRRYYGASREPRDDDESFSDERRFLIGVEKFNAGDWFEAHDDWEEVWRRSSGRRAEMLKSLIQLAVGLCHHFNGNLLGARKLYRSFLANRGQYEVGLGEPNPFGSFDVDRRLARLDWSSLSSAVARNLRLAETAGSPESAEMVESADDGADPPSFSKEWTPILVFRSDRSNA